MRCRRHINDSDTVHGTLLLMRNVLLWYLPQAVLFCLGAWLTINEPNGRMPVIVGLILAGIYTAAIMVARDAPANFRGLGIWGRRTFAVLFVLLIGLGFVAAGMIIVRGGNIGSSVVAMIALVGIVLLFWATALGLWHSFTVRAKLSPAGQSPEAEVLPPAPSRHRISREP